MSCKLKPTYGVGYVSKAKTGESFKVVKYEGRKQITIEFSCGLVRNTTSTNIKQGRVIYSKKRTSPITVGEVFISLEGEDVVVVTVKPKKRYTVRFPCGLEKEYGHASLLTGKITSKTTIQVGDIFLTNNFGEVTVTKYKDAHNVTVKFADGCETTVQATSLRFGNVGHPTSGLVTGQTFVNSDGCRGEVVEYTNPHNVSVKWGDGIITNNHHAASVKLGAVYYPNARTLSGVGYFGIGKYKSDKCGRTGNYDKNVFRKWSHMISRCYNEEEQKKPSCKAYIGVRVCEDWHNFQNFAGWAEEYLDKIHKGFELDKDLMGTGKEYSPDNCRFIPTLINGFLSDQYSSKKEDLPEGVNIIKPKTLNSKIGYVARCHIEGRRKYLGFFNTPREAGEVYKEAKEREGRRLAEVFKLELEPDEYLKLSKFTLKDIHRKDKGTSQ